MDGRLHLVMSWRRVRVVVATVTLVTATIAAIGISSRTPAAAAPSITVQSFAGTENVAFTVVVATYTGGAPSDTATIDWGDGSGTTAGSIDTSSSPYKVSGTHTYTDKGSYTVTVTINGATSKSEAGAATIADADIGFTTIVTPTYNCPGTGGQSAKPNCQVPEAGEGFPLTWNVQLSDPTPGVGESPSEYTAVVNWGDGSPPDTLTSTATPAGQILDDPTNGLMVHAVHTYLDEGSYSGLITMFENGDMVNTMFPPQLLAVGDDLISTKAPSNTVPPTFTLTEGADFTGPVATFTDSNPNSKLADFIAPASPPNPTPNPCGTNPPGTPKTNGICIDWGDGTQSPGTVSGPDGGPYSASGEHTYTEEGTYAVKVAVMDEGKAIGTGHATYTVVDAALSSTASPVSGVEGTATSVSASLTDASLFSGTSDFAVSIDWGDGTQSPGTVTNPLAPLPPLGNFAIAGSHTYTDEGTYTIKVTTTDDGGATVTATTTATIGDADSLSSTGTSITPSTGVPFTGTVANVSDTFTSLPAAGLNATIDWGDSNPPLGGTVTGSNGSFAVDGTHTYAHVGVYTVTVTVNDPGGAMTTATTTATVGQGDVLTFSAVPVVSTEGSAFSGPVENFTDISTTVMAGDFAATIDWGDGNGSAGTVTSNGSGGWVVSGGHTYADEGSYTVTTTVSVDGTVEPTATTVATVGDAALAATIAAINPVEGTSFSGPVATFTDANPGAVVGDFTATITWGDGHTSPGTVAGPSGGPFTVSGSNTYATVSSQTLTVKISDKGGSGAAVSGPVTVNDAPLAAAFGSLAPAEGQLFSGVVATFTDGDPGGTVPDYSATITWGDGTMSTGTVGLASPAGPFTVSGTHTYAEESTPSVTVKIADTGGAITSAAGAVTVADAPLAVRLQSLAPVEGAALNNTLVATFTDADQAGAAGDYTATISWGDGTTTTGTIAPISGGRFGVSGTHTYVEEGSDALSVTVSDAGSSSTDASSVTVGDAALSGTLTSPSITEGAAFVGGAIATFTDADPAGAAGDYSATIAWGDGHTSAGTVSGPTAGAFTVTGTNTYAEEGVYPASVTVKDGGGALTTINGNLTVGDATLSGALTAPSGTEGGAVSAVAHFTDADPGGTPTDYAATLTWGDGVTSLGTVTGPAAGVFTVTGSHTYAEEGTPALTLTISDAGGDVLTLGGVATVGDAALQPGTLTLAPGPIALSQVATFTFTDADPSGVATDYTFTVNWGDGVVSTGTVAAASGHFTGTASHTYATKNTYTVTVTATDAAGSAAAATGTATVKK